MPDRSVEYARLKRKWWFVELALTWGTLFGFLASGWAIQWQGWVMSHWQHSLLQVTIYMGAFAFGMTFLLLPLDWVQTFWTEHRFDLSTQRFSQWLWEYFKRVLAGGLLGWMALLVLWDILQITQQNWWLLAAATWLMWSVLLTHLGPILLIPIFYKQKPLADQRLKNRLEVLLGRCGEKVHGIFEIDLSRNTRKANACVCGLGKTRRVLISDTLLNHYPVEEVEVVLAHEAGHHKLKHLWILLAVGTMGAFFAFFAVDHLVRLSASFFGIFGFNDLAVIPLIGLWFTVVQLAIQPLNHAFSRLLETQADRFALKQTGDPKAFISTMKRLGQQNLAELNPPRWVEIFFYTHPPIAKRIALAQDLVNNRS